MVTCYLGDGVYRYNCDAVILSHGTPGEERFEYPSTNFTVYILKREAECGAVGGGTAILYYFDSTWKELSRTDTPSGNGYVYVLWAITSPGYRAWKIEWGDCIKEFWSGPIPQEITDPISTVILLPGGSAIVNGITVKFSGEIFRESWGGQTYIYAFVWVGSIGRSLQVNGEFNNQGISATLLEITNPVFYNGSGTADSITVRVCVQNWQCEPGQTGYESDGCGNRRANAECSPPLACKLEVI